MFEVKPYFLQQYKVWPFLTLERQKWPSNLTREYYLSFEDALWDLLPRLGYNKGSKLLVPSYYCIDVINNIKEHGYKVAYYPLNKDLSYSLQSVVTAIHTHKPDIFVDFAANGVQTNLSDEVYRKLPFHSLILHDRVHSLISSHVDNFMLSKRHLLISSSRKVSPLFGSMAVYSRNSRQSHAQNSRKYVTSAIVLWVKYLSLLYLAKLIRNTKLAIKAEKFLKKHDNLIGDSKHSAPLSSIYLRLIDHLAIRKVEECKLKQAEYYHNTFADIFSSTKRAWTQEHVEDNLRKLRGYPLIIKQAFANKFMKLCRESGFLTVSQLNNCNWSKSQKLFLLPLGPQVSMREIRNITNIAKKALTTAIQYDTISA